MIDLAWAGDAAKLFGGGVVGCIGKTVETRNKRRKLRRGLYRELLRNYFLVRGYIDKAKTMPGLNAPLRGVTVRADMFSRDYYQHAKKDIDAYNELKEAQSFDWFYREFDAIESLWRSGANGATPLFNTACRLAHTFEESFIAGTLDVRTAVKAADDERSAAFLTKQIAAMRDRGIPEDEYPVR